MRFTNYVLAFLFIVGMVTGLYPLAFAAFLLAALINKPIPGRLNVTPFQDTPCSVVINNTYDTHGTITRASFNPLTPSQLEALFKPSGIFAEMDDWFRTAFQMKACGTKVNSLYDWITSSARTDVKGLLDKVKLDKGPTLLKPFIMARQDSIINNDFWVISGGVAQSGYTPDSANPAVGTTSEGPLTTAQHGLGAATDRVIRVVTRYGIEMDAKWFLSRDRVHIFNKSGQTTLRGQWKVLAAASNTDLGYTDVLITSENSGSTMPWHQAPTSGVLVAGTNNVNDYESFCLNRPVLNPRKHVPFWYKTDRRGREVDDETMKVFARLSEGNKYFDTFQNLPLAEYHRQDEENYQKRWVNDFFYGKAIGPNQTLANWQSLEQITTVTGATVDPGLGGRLIAYRANPIGVIEQLHRCGRRIDLQNQALNFYEFLDENYRISRARKSQGRTVEIIDWFTNQRLAANIESAVIDYLDLEYNDKIRIPIEEGSNELGFSWKIFSKFKYPTGLKIALVTADFFDDMFDTFSDENIGSAGNVLWALDIGKPGPKGGTIYPAMIESYNVTVTKGALAELQRIDTTFACTMRHITSKVQMSSSTWSAVVECPANSLAIEGIADVVPITTGRSGSTQAAYENLYGWAIVGFGLAMSAFGLA